MNEKGVVKNLVFRHKKGMHARVAAMIVQKTYELQNKYNTFLCLKKENMEDIPLGSLLILLSLKIKAGDEIKIAAYGGLAEEAATEMAVYLESDFVVIEEPAISTVDSLLQDNFTTAEQIFKSMANGLIVIDENDVIILFNPAAERIFKLHERALSGKRLPRSSPERAWRG